MRLRCAPLRAGRPVGSLSNIGVNQLQQKGSWYLRISRSTAKRQAVVAEKVRRSVIAVCRLYGTTRILGLTLTLSGANRQPNPTAATRPWHRLESSFIRRRKEIVGWFRILAPQSDGTPHLHVVIVVGFKATRLPYPAEIRKGQKSKRSLTSAAKVLRRELLAAAQVAGFGPVSRIHPIRKTIDAFAAYHGNHFTKGIARRYIHLRNSRRVATGKHLPAKVRLKYQKCVSRGLVVAACLKGTYFS